MQSALFLRFPLLAGCAACAGFALGASSALGQTTVVVTASVQEACSLEAEELTLDFGVYNDAQVTRTASFTYDCPAGKDVTFSLMGSSADAAGYRGLPNVQNGGTPLLYRILDPLGNPWIDDFNIPSTAGGEQSRDITGVLDPGQLADVMPGQFMQQLTLEMAVNN